MLQLAGRRCVRLIFGFPFLRTDPWGCFADICREVETLVLVLWTIHLGFLKGRIGQWVEVVIMEEVLCRNISQLNSKLAHHCHWQTLKSKAKERKKTTNDHYPRLFHPG